MVTAKSQKLVTGTQHPSQMTGLLPCPEEGPQGTWGLVGKTKGLQVGTLKFASDFASNLLCDLWQV